MAHPLILYILIVVLAGSLSIFLCVYALVKIKNMPGAKYFILATLMSGLFTISYAFELASVTLEQILFWIRIEYLALPFIPVLVLLMCLEYIGVELKGWHYFFLFGIPIMTIFFHYTNDFHHWYYKEAALRSDTPFPIADLTPGFFFYVHSLSLYLCIGISVLILLTQLKKVQRRFRMQILMMVIGLVIPVIGSLFYITGMSPNGIDLGPVSMSVSFLFHAFALVSFQMFNVVPIARDSVFESMKQGVIVLNQNDVIVDYNKAVLQIIPLLNKTAIGKPVINMLDENIKLAKIIISKQECDYEVISKSSNRWFHIRFSPVHNKKHQQIGLVITFMEITELFLMQKKLKHLASFDGLTQIYNRIFFLEETRKALKSHSKERIEICMIMFDIDYFKKVNDSFGHEAGDRVLIQVAQTVKACLGPNDFYGRYGGEEFVICMLDISLQEAYSRVEALRLRIAESSVNIHDKKIRVTSSFGLANAALTEDNFSNLIEPLIQQADQALYTAKKQGRNRVCIYSHSFYHQIDLSSS